MVSFFFFRGGGGWLACSKMSSPHTKKQRPFFLAARFPPAPAAGEFQHAHVHIALVRTHTHTHTPPLHAPPPPLRLGRGRLHLHGASTSLNRRRRQPSLAGARAASQPASAIAHHPRISRWLAHLLGKALAAAGRGGRRPAARGGDARRRRAAPGDNDKQVRTSERGECVRAWRQKGCPPAPGPPNKAGRRYVGWAGFDLGVVGAMSGGGPVPHAPH